MPLEYSTVAAPVPAFFALPQFINCRGKTPWDHVRGVAIDPTDPANWLSHAEAVATGHPYGFVFTADCGFAPIDLDNVWDGSTYTRPDAAAIVEDCRPLDAAWEFSQSGKGLHIVGRVDALKVADRVNKLPGWAEQYAGSPRFIAFGRTGWNGSGSADITDVIAKHWPARAEAAAVMITGARSEYTGPTDDAQLIAKMLGGVGSTAAQFGGKATARQLWTGDVAALSGFYPSVGDQFDRSSADAALMSHLAFWTGCDAARMDRLFRQSALCRPKYRDRLNYREPTISNAISGCKKVYDRVAPAGMPGVTVPANIETLRNFVGDGPMAEAFVTQHRDVVRHVTASDEWFIWDGHRWALDGRGSLAFDMVHRFLKSIADTDPHCASMARSDWRSLMSHRMAKSVLAIVGGHEVIRVKAADFDADRLALNTPAGIIDLRTGALSPHDPARMMTKITAVSPASLALCPLWQATVSYACQGDPEFVEFIRRVFAYGLTGDTRFEALFFLYGDGGSGKGTILNTMLATIGRDYSTTADADTFLEAKQVRHLEDIADLHDARTVVVQEMPRGKAWDAKRVKSLTGGDTIKARELHKSRFEFDPQMTLIFASNHKPRIRDVDEAIRRRLHLLPFTVTVPKAHRDETLKRRLLDEREGIMRWALDGLPALWSQGLNPPQIVVDATAEYLDDEDTLSAWLKSECEIEEVAAWTQSSVAYANYVEFVAQRNVPGMAFDEIERPISQQDFTGEIQKRGFGRSNRKGIKGFLGLKLKSRTANVLRMPGTANVLMMPGLAQ